MTEKKEFEASVHGTFRLQGKNTKDCMDAIVQYFHDMPKDYEDLKLVSFSQTYSSEIDFYGYPKILEINAPARKSEKPSVPEKSEKKDIQFKGGKDEHK